MKRPKVRSPSLVRNADRPTWLALGQSSPERLCSNGEMRGAWNRVRGQAGVTLGLRISPVGMSMRRSRRSPSGKTVPGCPSNSPPGLNPTPKLSSYGWVPDAVAGSPPSAQTPAENPSSPGRRPKPAVVSKLAVPPVVVPEEFVATRWK